MPVRSPMKEFWIAKPTTPVGNPWSATIVFTSANATRKAPAVVVARNPATEPSS